MKIQLVDIILKVLKYKNAIFNQFLIYYIKNRNLY